MVDFKDLLFSAILSGNNIIDIKIDDFRLIASITRHILDDKIIIIIDINEKNERHNAIYQLHVPNYVDKDRGGIEEVVTWYLKKGKLPSSCGPGIGSRDDILFVLDFDKPLSQFETEDLRMIRRRYIREQIEGDTDAIVKLATKYKVHPMSLLKALVPDRDIPSDMSLPIEFVENDHNPFDSLCHNIKLDPSAARSGEGESRGTESRRAESRGDELRDSDDNTKESKLESKTDSRASGAPDGMRCKRWYESEQEYCGMMVGHRGLMYCPLHIPK